MNDNESNFQTILSIAQNYLVATTNILKDQRVFLLLEIIKLGNTIQLDFRDDKNGDHVDIDTPSTISSHSRQSLGSNSNEQ